MASLFLSYSHRDKGLRERLETHLASLKRQGIIDIWHDKRILAGDDFAREIDKHIETDDIILLLVSSYFLASDYCYEKEMMRAMERHEAGDAIVIPVILRACDWRETPFGKLQAIPSDGRPVAKFPDRDQGLLEVARAVRVAAERLTSKGTKHPSVGVRKELATIGETLSKRIQSLQISSQIRTDIMSVVKHAGFPGWMSVSGALVKNPIWETLPVSKANELAEIYRPSGDNPPQVMHLDVLLTRRNDERGHGQLYTYFSPDWATYLLIFRPRLSEDKRSERNLSNATKIARHWSLPPDKVEVKPLRGKYVVSIKPHPKYGDLILYVFEFCSVVFKDGVISADDPRINPEADTAKPSRKWLDLRTLRSDETSWSVNGDVIRGIHELFTYDLGPLPVAVR